MTDTFTISGLSRLFGRDRRKVTRLLEGVEPVHQDGRSRRYSVRQYADALLGDLVADDGTLLDPLKHAVGQWNFEEVSPAQLMGRFNGFVKSVVLRVSEARDLGDTDRYGFYEHIKVYTAAPPDVLRCDEKNVREYSVMNVSGVVITTNNIG